MQGNRHRHKRTVAVDVLGKSLSQSIDLNLNRYSFNNERDGPLTLRLTHFQSNREQNQNKMSPQSNIQVKMKKSNIEGNSSTKIIEKLRNNLLHLEQKISQAHKQINSSPSTKTNKRQTIGALPTCFQHMFRLSVCNQVSQDESTINLQSQKLLNIKSKQTSTLHINNYYTGHLVKILLGYSNYSPRFLIEIMDNVKRAMIIKIPQIDIEKKGLLKKIPQGNRKTIILELQGTLLSIRQQKLDENDVDISTGINKFYVSLRPYLFSFLKKIKQFFQIVIFTSLPLQKASQILDEIDPQRKYFSECLGQQSCQTIKDLKYKDIRLLNRSIKQICIIDSRCESIFDIDNWIPILPFNGEFQDRQLMQLQRFLLRQISKCMDVREIIKNRLKINRYWQYENWQNLVKQLYLE